MKHRLLLLFFFFCFVNNPLMSACIEVFKDNLYRGQSWNICDPKTNSNTNGWDEVITSMQIPKGIKVKVCKGIKKIGKESYLGVPPCRNYFQSVPNVGSFFNDSISYIEFDNFSFNDFSMIISSDPQLFWACSTGPCRAKATGIEAQGRLSNQWQIDSMKKVATEVGFNKFAGVIINGDLTSFGHKKDARAFIEYYENKFPLNVWPGLGNHDYANNVDDCARNNCAIRMMNYLMERINSLNVKGRDFIEGKVTYSFPKLKKEYKGSFSYSFDVGNFHFIQLNNYPTYQTKFDGWNLRKARRDYFEITSSLDWLKRDLEMAAGKKIIINLHDYSGHFNHKNRNKFKKVIRGHYVVAIFAGHIHSSVGLIRIEKIGNRNIPVFRSGGSSYNTYLRVDFQPTGMEVSPMSSIEGNIDQEKQRRFFPYETTR